MYRDKLEEIRKAKGISNKRWSEESGVSLDTIGRIIRPENPEKDSPRVSTLEDLCEVLGVELWEIFYVGDRSAPVYSVANGKVIFKSFTANFIEK